MHYLYLFVFILFILFEIILFEIIAISEADDLGSVAVPFKTEKLILQLGNGKYLERARITKLDS